MMKEISVPLIQKMSQPILEGAGLASLAVCWTASAAASARLGAAMVIASSERSCGRRCAACSTYPVSRN
jgi:hypothetical protein